MAKGNKKPNKSKTKKPKKLKPFERPSEGNPDSAAQTPDVYYNNGPGKHGHNTMGSLRRSKKVFAGLNGSQLKTPDISGAILTLSLSIRILNSQCVEGARDVRFFN